MRNSKLAKCYANRSVESAISAVMEDVGATVFYDDEDECLDYECLHNVEYDYDYVDAEKENLHELYEYCLNPTLYNTAYHMLPLLCGTILFRLFVHARKILFSVYTMGIIVLFALPSGHSLFKLRLNWLAIFIFQDTYRTRYFIYRR